MFTFATILSGLQAVIAARAARDRTLSVLLVALCGRIARMGARLDRLIALWRAGTLPAPRAARVRQARAERTAPVITTRFPNKAGWLRQKCGYEVSVYALYLQQQLTDGECTAFLAACPRAGRILRPLLRMLTPDPVPEIIRLVRRAVELVAAPLLIPAGVAVIPTSKKMDA